MSKKARPDNLLQKGQKVIATISSIAPGGDGVSKDHGVPIFVHRAAPGDVAEVELYDVRKDFARGRLVRLIEPSARRTEPPCKLFKVCGGCQLQHLPYEDQLFVKQDIVKQAIKHIGRLDPDMVKSTLAAPLPLNYRNKVQFPVANPAGSDRILAGYYKQDSHELVNIKHCPIQPEVLDRMLEAVKEVCQSHRIRAYDENTRRGLLRHIVARYSFYRGQTLVTLVINSQPGKIDATSFKQAADEIMQRVPEVAGVCLNFNPRAGNRILGDETVVVAGQAYLIEKLFSGNQRGPLNGLEFRLSASSFFQVNPAQAAALMDVVLDAVPEGAGLLIDAYAGVGSFAMWLSSACSRVIAIEEFAGAVQDGQENLRLNKITNVEFHHGTVEASLPLLDRQGVRPDVVLLDPPRKGVTPEALNSVIALNAPLVIYVSCNPATLARDLKILEINGYKTRDIQPIDMFPQTYHVESVTVLRRSNQ